jgi:hypothetical protein
VKGAVAGWMRGLGMLPGPRAVRAQRPRSARSHAALQEVGHERAGKNHTDRVEQYELGVLADGLGVRFHRVPAMKWASSSIAWPVVSSPLYFRGGVTPAGSGTWATFSVIDTRL